MKTVEHEGEVYWFNTDPIMGAEEVVLYISVDGIECLSISSITMEV